MNAVITQYTLPDGKTLDRVGNFWIVRDYNFVLSARGWLYTPLPLNPRNVVAAARYPNAEAAYEAWEHQTSSSM